MNLITWPKLFEVTATTSGPLAAKRLASAMKTNPHWYGLKIVPGTVKIVRGGCVTAISHNNKLDMLAATAQADCTGVSLVAKSVMLQAS